MAGYAGYSKSNNAVVAEAEGKMVLTKAVKYARSLGFAGVTGRDIKQVIGPCEWHHTSKFYNCVDYYDPTELDDPDAADELREVIALRKRHVAVLKTMKAAGYTGIWADGEKLGLDIYEPLCKHNQLANIGTVELLEKAMRNEDGYELS